MMNIWSSEQRDLGDRKGMLGLEMFNNYSCVRFMPTN